jgi:outer membrane protein assembly factor BamB
LTDPFRNIASVGNSIYDSNIGEGARLSLNSTVEGALVMNMTAFARIGAFVLSSIPGVWILTAEAHPPAGGSQDSVAYQINQDHTGNINFTEGFSGSLTQLWSIDLNGIVSYPITANGMAFVTVGTNSASLLVAISLSSGTVVWEKLLPGSSSWADATYDSGNVYVLNGTGNLLAFSASNGDKLWSTQLAEAADTYGAPAAGGGIVALQYGEDYEQYVAAYKSANGANIWTISSDNEAIAGIAGVPIVEKNGIYLGVSDENDNSQFLDLSPKRGSTIWSTTISCSPADAPVLLHKYLYVTVDSQYGCSGSDSILNLANGKSKGSFSGAAAPAVLGKTIIVSIDGVLYDYSPSNDNVYWSFSGEDGYLDSSPIVINGYVAALSSEYGDLYLLDGSTGEQLWTTNLGYNDDCCSDGPDTGLGAGEGVMLVPYGDTLYAFAPQQGAKLGSQPEPRHAIGHLINGHFVPG